MCMCVCVCVCAWMHVCVCACARADTPRHMVDTACPALVHAYTSFPDSFPLARAATVVLENLSHEPSYWPMMPTMGATGVRGGGGCGGGGCGGGRRLIMCAPQVAELSLWPCFVRPMRACVEKRVH